MKTKTSGKKKAILLSTGSLNPIHEGHVQMLKLAKMHLETKGYEVVGGSISPTHDEYVQKSTKMNTDPDRLSESGEVRFDLVKNAISDLDWLKPDTSDHVVPAIKGVNRGVVVIPRENETGVSSTAKDAPVPVYNIETVDLTYKDHSSSKVVKAKADPSLTPGWDTYLHQKIVDKIKQCNWYNTTVKELKKRPEMKERL